MPFTAIELVGLFVAAAICAAAQVRTRHRAQHACGPRGGQPHREPGRACAGTRGKRDRAPPLHLICRKGHALTGRVQVSQVGAAQLVPAVASLQEERRIREIRDILTEEFEVEAETCTEDVFALLTQLLSWELVEIRNGKG